jgi:hypothetical protein
MRFILLLISLCWTATCIVSQAETYVSEENVSIDRCGTAWFITRFVDANAQFKFFKKEDPAPQGITYGFFGSQYFNKGPDCTFTVMVKAHHKADLKPLQLMSEQINDIFAWRAGPDSLSRHLRDGIGDLRRANNSDLETYQRLFPVFDCLYLAYGGDRSKMLPEAQRNSKHLPVQILLETGEGAHFKNLPAYPTTDNDEEFSKAIESIYQQLPLDPSMIGPLDKTWENQCREHGWTVTTYGPLFKWLDSQTLVAQDKQALKKIYLFIYQRVVITSK